jgi:hypothetical protein
MTRKIATVVLALFPALALAAWSPAIPGQPGEASVYEVQGTTSPVTRGAPTVGVDGVLAGINLANPQLAASQAGTHGLSITVCSATGTTLSGAGTITFYGYDPATPEWAFIPDLTQSVTATTRCQTFLGLQVATPRGRLMAVATGVTFSAGSAGLSVYMMAR